jgi:hypothetical protein
MPSQTLKTRTFTGVVNNGGGRERENLENTGKHPHLWKVVESVLVAAVLAHPTAGFRKTVEGGGSSVAGKMGCLECMTTSLKPFSLSARVVCPSDMKD